MSVTVIQNKWDGGHAEDLRTTAVDECEKSLNFDIFTNPHLLIPYPDSIADTLNSGNMSDIQVADVDISVISGTNYITGSGYESSVSTKTAFYTKLGGSLSSNFEQQAVAAAGAYVKGTGVVYKDLFYALRYNGSGTWNLDRFNGASVTNCGSISSSVTSCPRPFVHPLDNKLYIAIGTTISSWDNSTLTTTTTILPSGMTPTSLTDYGSYLAIAMTPTRGNGKNVVYLWGRDATINTLQGNIDFGEGNLLILESLNNTLIGIVQPQYAFSTAITNKIIVRQYAGGAVETLKSIVVGTSDNLASVKTKNADKLYFGSQNADDCVYVVGKNKEGRYVITKDRYLDNGTTTTSGLKAVSMIGDVMWRGINSTYKLMRSSTTYTSTSVFRTTINPSMPLGDRYKLKQLEAVQISYTGASTGTTAVKYSVDGSAFTSVISATNATGEQVAEATNENDGTVFLSGREFQFQLESSGGAKIKEIRYRYSVLNTVV